MSRYVLALDQGTTSSRAILFDRDGAVVASDQHEFPQHFPKPGWVEHDPDEIWDSQLRAARGVLARAKATAADIVAIGITNQRETTVVWDRASGEPIHRAIVWQSRQTAPICERLRADGLEPEVRARTGLVVDAYFSGTKVRFILDAVPGAQARAARGELAFGTIDAFLLQKLTKGRVHATEYSNASRTMLYDIHDARVERRAARGAARAARDAAGGARVERGVRRDRPRVVRPRDPDRGHGGRPAGGALRAGLLRGGAREEHLRHGLLPAAQHRHRSRDPRRRVCSRRSRGASAAPSSTRSKAASSSRGRPCSGCATACA